MHENWRCVSFYANLFGWLSIADYIEIRQRIRHYYFMRILKMEVKSIAPRHLLVSSELAE